MEGMKNLDIRVYRETVKAAVAAEREADPNWSWGIRSLKKGIVEISWGYLDYIGEKDCFTVEVLQDEENGEVTVYGTNPNGNQASRVRVPKQWHDGLTHEEGIASAIHGMASSAHRTY